jgi:hypothetical protein
MAAFASKPKPQLKNKPQTRATLLKTNNLTFVPKPALVPRPKLITKAASLVKPPQKVQKPLKVNRNQKSVT